MRKKREKRKRGRRRGVDRGREEDIRGVMRVGVFLGFLDQF